MLNVFNIYYQFLLCKSPNNRMHNTEFKRQNISADSTVILWYRLKHFYFKKKIIYIEFLRRGYNKRPILILKKI